jgi:hypothetical protein
LFKLEIDTSSHVFNPDLGYELSKLLDDIRRQVRGFETGFTTAGGAVYHGRGGVVGRWTLTEEAYRNDPQRS